MIILMCGSFAGKGYSILKSIANFCNEYIHEVKVLLVPDLYPVPNPENYTPAEARLCSAKAIDQADAAIFAFLRPETLGVTPGEYDLTGGVGFEIGVSYEQMRRGRIFYAAFLFDGYRYRAKVSTLLRGPPPCPELVKETKASALANGGLQRCGAVIARNLEAVASRPGNLEELSEMALQLCISLVGVLRCFSQQGPNGPSLSGGSQ